MPKTQTNIENLDKEVDKDKDDKPRKSSASKRSSSRSKSSDNDLRARLTTCFDRIAEALEERGDMELASIVGEDAEVMAAGLVSMTAPLKVLRTPLLIAAAIVEPLLAFGRIGRVLIGRFAERRARAIADHEAAQDEYAAANA